MWRHTVSALVASVVAAVLSGCVATQARMNTLNMVDSVSRIRDVQVLRNIAAAINDHDMVPTQILLSTGQASVSTGVSPTLTAPHFRLFQSPGELDVEGDDTWTAQWQVSPVTNADDLRRLRNLYVLIVSTDEQYDALQAYFVRHPDLRAASECYGLQSPSSTVPATAAEAEAHKAADPSAASAAKPQAVCPPGYGAGQIPKWREALVVIENGDSIGCKLYQEASATDRERAPRDSLKGIPFRRWLFWRKSGGSWSPTAPDETPQSLGTYGGWELGTTSRACFNDFVILAQSATPETAGSSAQGARVMLSTH
jgi:hypothetical protein